MIRLIKGKNEHEVIVVQPNTIRSEGATQLNLLQQRILFYSMLKIQKNKTTSTFSIREIEERFDVDFGSNEKIKNNLHFALYHPVLSYCQTKCKN